MEPQEAYQKLLDHSRETAVYDSMRRLLGWDQRTCLPSRGHAHRARQLATLAGLLNRRATDPMIGEMLSAVEGSDLVSDALSDVAVNIREWRRIYDRAVRIPEDLRSHWPKPHPKENSRGKKQDRKMTGAAFCPTLKIS